MKDSAAFEKIQKKRNHLRDISDLQTDADRLPPGTRCASVFSLPDARTLQGIEVRRLKSAGMISLPFGIKYETEKDQGTGE